MGTEASPGEVLQLPAHPAGAYVPENAPTSKRRGEWILDLEGAPERLRRLVVDLTAEQLDTPYRNWSIRRIVHHVADSHINGYVRFKWALTEPVPRIKAYEQGAWSDLPDSAGPIELSLDLLEALHRRWLLLIRSMAEADFARTFIHPEGEKTRTLGEVLGLYAWHARHHSAAIAWVRRHRLGLAEPT
jgi:hypothetical protein